MTCRDVGLAGGSSGTYTPMIVGKSEQVGMIDLAHSLHACISRSRFHTPAGFNNDHHTLCTSSR